jgi:hypothetical protein
MRRHVSPILFCMKKYLSNIGLAVLFCGALWLTFINLVLVDSFQWSEATSVMNVVLPYIVIIAQAAVFFYALYRFRSQSITSILLYFSISQLVFVSLSQLIFFAYALILNWLGFESLYGNFSIAILVQLFLQWIPFIILLYCQATLRWSHLKK